MSWGLMIRNHDSLHGTPKLLLEGKD